MAHELFVQPHFDDVALSCGGLVARAHDLGSAPVMATVFGAGPAGPLSSFALQFRALWGVDDPVPVRQREDARAAACLGATTVWLPFCDAIYRGERYLSVEALTGAPHPDDDELRDALAARLLGLAVEVGASTVYLPLGVGGHVDHQLVHLAGAALEAAGLEVRYYEDLPYAVRPGAVESRRASLGGAWRPTVVEIGAQLERKLAAVEAYASQLGALARNHGPVPEVLLRYAESVGGPGRPAERFWSRAAP